MAKYTKLGLHLKTVMSEKIQLSFQDIEKILGFSLPESAEKHRSWWANDNTHVQALNGWIEHGCRVGFIDLAHKVVIFHKVDRPGQNREYTDKKHNSPATPAIEFENEVRAAMSEYYDTKLYPGQVSDVPKLFDMVSEDKEIVGEAKYLTMVRNNSVPSAKFSIISEHVWFLEKTVAQIRFIVFGNDIEVPKAWLRKYGMLSTDVEFYFYDINTKEIEKLTE